ncbi:MAG: recombinase family protein [Chloroflexota bacterium]|nr:MAG: recombinase family protein [Chloroflexota bacterium]
MQIAVYVRVSTRNQAEQHTIEQQLERLYNHIQAQGWTLPDENIFRDDGYSGSNLHRPGLDRLRDQAAGSALALVLVTAPDRLARKYVHQVLLIEELEQKGCKVEFLDRPMSQDPHDQLLLQIRGAVAEYERTLIAERMRRGRLSKFRAGVLLPWTRPPYGYRLHPERPRDPTGVRQDLAEAGIVAEIFAEYLEDGVGLMSLAKKLHEQQISSPTGKTRWGISTLRGILTNPAYTGQVYAGRMHYQPPKIRRSATHPIGQPHASATLAPQEEWIPVAQIPAIVSQEQFDLVQAKLATNQSFAKRHNTAHQYLLRALVSCGICQLSCYARTVQGKPYGYYICTGKDDEVQARHATKCPSRFIPAKQLDDLVWQDLCDLLTHPDLIAQAMERAQGNGWLPQELQARQENLRKGKASLEQQLNRLTEAYLSNVIPLIEYQRRRKEIEQRQQALENQTNQLVAQADRYKELAGLAGNVKDFCQRIQTGLAEATFEQIRQLVELLIDRVIVTGDEVEIHYVIPTSRGSEHVRFCLLRSDYFNAPDLVAATDFQVAQQVGINLVLRTRLAGVGPRGNPGDAHVAHITLHPRPRNRPAFPQKHRRHPPRAINRILRVNLIDAMFDRDFFGRGADRFVVQAGTAQAQQLGLGRKWQFGGFPLQQPQSFTAPEVRGQIFF